MTETANRSETPSKGVSMFTFGDPESVLDRHGLFDHLECARVGRWYEPPINMRALVKTRHVSPYHGSAMALKRNLLIKSFVPGPLLSRGEFSGWVFDYLLTGNAYLERIDNMAGRPLTLKRALAVHTRRGVEPGRFFYLPRPDSPYHNRGVLGLAHEFARDSVHHLFEPDAAQEIYGLPEYLSAMQSALLGEAATLFRRRYYMNGSHAGFIFYMTESTISDEDAAAIDATLKKTRGVGNFRNLFVHSPGGKPDGIKIIPISEVAAKDEFLGIKGASRDDVLAAWRVPPQLIGVIPTNNGGFGDVGKAAETFFQNEIVPIQMRLTEINDWLGAEAVRFEDHIAPQS